MGNIGLTTIIITYKTLALLEVNPKIKRASILLMSFFPNAIIFSGILLRENFISAFIAVSFYFFTKWYKNSSTKYIFYSIVFVLLASAFHAGVFGVAIGYAFMYMFYKHNINELRLSGQTITLFICFIVLFCFLFFNYRDVFFSKFSRIEDTQDIYNVANARRGGSAYLGGLTINTKLEMVLFSPIKMFYFLVAPLPMDWRGLYDIIAFFFDGIIYGYLVIYSWRNMKKVKEKIPLLQGVLITLLVVFFIFGVSVTNAGTAMRHRHKMFSIMVVFYAIVVDNNDQCFEGPKQTV